jgi:rod shape-determining protein MreD
MPIRLPSLSVADPNEVLRPVHPAFVAITLVLALLLNLLPLTGTALMLRPDFLALVLLYWCIQAPRYVGVGIAWFMGLLMDVGDATPSTSAAACCAFRSGSRRCR